MSRENVEIVRSIYEAVNRRDPDAAFRDQDPKVELTTPERGFNSGTYRGREEIQRYWQEMFSAFEAVSLESR
jgi:ketosteroid isomerase-like protein